MADRRIFTLSQANALVPRLNLLVGEQVQRRARIESELKVLARRFGKPQVDLDDEPDDDDATRARKRAVAAEIRTYEGAWDEIERMGGALKDPRLGLVDFYGEVDGRLVWLCWRYGETRITHYHALDEGFSRRKPLPEADGARPLLN